jgi:hypothetical protein
MHELLTNVSAAIAFYIGKPIQLGPIFSEPLDFWCMVGGRMALFRTGQVVQMGGQSFKLEGDVSGFQSFCSSYIDSSRANPWLALCNRRLLKLSDEMSLEDKIVDIITILEIIYLPDSNAELKYKLCVRCAKLLETDSSSCQHKFNLLRVAYDARSNIVHGGNIAENTQRKIDKQGINVSELIEKVQSLLLRSLRILGLDPKLRDKDKLDSHVLNARNRKCAS